MTRLIPSGPIGGPQIFASAVVVAAVDLGRPDWYALLSLPTRRKTFLETRVAFVFPVAVVPGDDLTDGAGNLLTDGAGNTLTEGTS